MTHRINNNGIEGPRWNTGPPDTQRLTLWDYAAMILITFYLVLFWGLLIWAARTWIV